MATESESELLIEDRDRVRYLTLNRPEKRNALTNANIDALFEALADADADAGVGSIVLRGAGKSFCAGVDMAPTNIDLDYEERSLRQELALVDPYRRFASLWNLSTPVIASIHGHCLGVGTDLAFHADMTVCTDDAQFGYPVVRTMGSPPTHMWTYLGGPQWAKRLLLTGDTIDGATAERVGFVLEAVPANELADATHELAAKVASVPADLLAHNKAICNKVIELMGWTMAQELARETNTMAHKSPASTEFGAIVASDGLKAAIEWQQAQLG